MKKRPTGNASNELRVELKYCERCGGLWFRECGTTRIYCDDCLLKVAELPVPRRSRTSPQLPVATRAFIDDAELDFSDMDELDMQSAGGVE